MSAFSFIFLDSWYKKGLASATLDTVKNDLSLPGPISQRF